MIGLAASTRIEVHGRSALLLTGNRLVERRDYGDPLNFVAEVMERIKVPARDNLPRFSGGLVGCFGYDTVRYIEPRLAGADKPDPLGTPDILLLLSEEMAIVDNLSGKLTLVVVAEPEVPGAFTSARASACASCLPGCVRRCRSRWRSWRSPRLRCRASAKRNSRPPCSAPRTTSSKGTSCRWCCPSA